MEEATDAEEFSEVAVCAKGVVSGGAVEACVLLLGGGSEIELESSYDLVWGLDIPCVGNDFGESSGRYNFEQFTADDG